MTMSAARPTTRLSATDLYVSARESFIAVLRQVPDEKLDDIVPATPLWTARDVAAHLAGVCEDLVNSKLPTPETFTEWTQAQVDRRKGWPLDGVLEFWDGLLQQAAEGFQSGRISETPCIDVATHEQDLRGFLPLPGGRSEPAYRFGVAGLRGRFLGQVTGASLPVLAIETESGRWVSAESEPESTLSVAEFELFRACGGRRSFAQMAAFDWNTDPTPYLPLIPIFGPRADDLVEPDMTRA